MPDAKFDTMAAMQTLQRAGVAERQAQATVEVLVASQRNLATKDDLDRLRMEMNARFDLMQSNFERLEGRVDAKIDALEDRIMIKLGFLVVAAIGATAMLMRLFPPA